MKKATLLKWEHKIWTQLKVPNLKVLKSRLYPFFQKKPISNNCNYVAICNMYIHNTRRDRETQAHNLHRNIYMQPLHCFLAFLNYVKCYQQSILQNYLVMYDYSPWFPNFQKNSHINFGKLFKKGKIINTSNLS